jgi:anti-sigma B factor antagonist
LLHRPGKKELEEETMSVRIEIRERASVVTLDLYGRFVHGDGPDELARLVKQILDEGKKRILVNLAGVSKVDTTGLGALVGCYVSATNRDAAVKLLNPTKKIKDLLVITKLVTVFEVFEDEDEAIKSFEETRTPSPDGAVAASR